jgi:outer membrane protein assembly factor BamD (BamD/ComL family)
MELERKNKPGAISFLQLCIKNSANNGSQRNKAFLQLGNLSFESRNYRMAKKMYDSLNMTTLARDEDFGWLNDRKAALAIIVPQLDIIDRQDSLQRIAALPPAQRDALLKKMARTLRRLQGLRDEDQDDGTNAFTNSQNKNVPDLFGANSASAADWYFNNLNLKAKGYSDFKNKWGNRPNVDNWQVSSIMKNTFQAASTRNNPGFESDSASKGSAKTGIDYKSLLNNLPLTPDKMKKSMDSIENAMFLLGKTYQEGVTDYQYAIDTYDSVLTKFPETRLKEQILLNLYYCYTKLGDQANAARMLELLKQKFPGGAFTARAVNPDSVAEAENSFKVKATHQYEKIYDAFIEGRFDSAIAQKRVADSLYGNKYWTPQLLYIESIYFIRSRRDPEAKVVLSDIQKKFPKTPMADKATTMLDVLNRRRQIEDYLTRLQVTRAKDDDIVAAQPDTAAQGIANRRPRLVRNDSNMLKKDDTSSWARAKLREQALAGIKDSTAGTGPSKLKPDTTQLAAKLRTLNSAFALDPTKPHSVMLVMNKVDPVYVSEAKNAFSGYNQENFYSLSLTAENASLNDSVKMVVIGGFPSDKEALDYLQNVKALAPRQIVPWLPANKYSFFIISGTNLQLLLSAKDLNAYRQFLSAAYPGKF